MLKTPVPAGHSDPASLPYGTASRDEVGAALFEHGSVKVDGLYDSDMIKSICDAAYRIYFERDRQIIGEGISNDDVLRDHRQRAIALESIIVDGTPAGDLLANEFARGIAEHFLGHMPRPSVNSYVRCARPANQMLTIPFHQDTRILGCPLINLWVPLVDCGIHEPGLEVVRKRVTELEQPVPAAGTLYSDFGIEIDEELVIARYGRRSLWHPEFRIGDAFLFFGTTIHRTYLTDTMARERLSIDLRLT